MVKTDHIKYIDDYDKKHAPTDHVFHPTTKRELRRMKQSQSLWGNIGETLTSTLKNVPLVGEQVESQQKMWEESNLKQERLKGDNNIGWGGITLEDTVFNKLFNETEY
ncbi:predicted protein [Naegleria gruberi]|uniref:Predicted protein n=1 Tax=Naegleria gruberi TaxID=5762 RepID=D2VGL5_NAEGR|nr:uncharacterized protein NAEGRDRAFT_68022 [Naegleria gruberi]EFC43987.1 predicted protein [Naegleria gruberi]|eukprot:XP_002676731.1 predicted protein [Naegleria gruberi strain NEG-M]